jgi:hypothetical protein
MSLCSWDINDSRIGAGVLSVSQPPFSPAGDIEGKGKEQTTFWIVPPVTLSRCLICVATCKNSLLYYILLVLGCIFIAGTVMACGLELLFAGNLLWEGNVIARRCILGGS